MTETSGGLQQFDHIVLTRFNVRMQMYPHAATDQWLRERLALFRRYCLPCVQAQTSDAFRWLLFFDAGSPEWFRDEVEALADDRIRPVWVDGWFDVDVAREAVVAVATAPYLITTRLDNDDAVAVDFIERIQAEFRSQELEFVNLVDGAQLAGGKVYLRPYTRNPFISLIEKRTEEQPKSVFVSRHFAVDTVGPVRNVKTPHPMWLQVIHDDNTLNERVGLRTRASRVAPWFACDLGLPESDPGYGADRMRDGARIALRLLKKPSRVVDLAQTVFARKPATAPTTSAPADSGDASLRQEDGRP